MANQLRIVKRGRAKDMYDIIGDIHGHADKLVALLTKLGYEETQGVWSHPDRILISVGDLVDRGPKQRDVVNILRTMQENKKAIVLMGNHEFNAVSWALTDSTNQPLRAHTEKNFEQHQAFLKQATPNSAWYKESIQWFMSLPLFFETNDFVCVHAAWDVKHVSYLKETLNTENGLDSEQWELANQEGHPLYNAIEYCLKGPEVPLPSGTSFIDGGGHVRNKIRLRWWDADRHSTYQTHSLSVPDPLQLPSMPIPSEYIVSDISNKPIFFGHYWMMGEPALLSDKKACLDWSVLSSKGHLVAYRFDGEDNLIANKLVWA